MPLPTSVSAGSRGEAICEDLVVRTVIARTAPNDPLFKVSPVLAGWF